MNQNLRVLRLEPEGPSGLEAMELDQADFQSPLPEQKVHVYFEDEALGLSVGVWTTTSMQEAFGPYPGDEFMWILEGQVKMVDSNGDNTLIKRGESFCIRNAIPISWKQEGFLRKFYLTFSPPHVATPNIETSDEGVMVLNPEELTNKLEAMDTTDPFIIDIGNPVQRDAPVFTNDSGNMYVGMWDSTDFVSEMKAFPAYEFVQLLEGDVAIVEADGTIQEFTAGDAFFIPMGTICQWKVSGYIKKYYAIVEPLD